MNSAGKLVIVGAGPSGLAAALEGTKYENEVLIFEVSRKTLENRIHCFME